jgi:hypothetical protein
MTTNVAGILNGFRTKRLDFALTTCVPGSIDTCPYHFDNRLKIAARPERVFDVLAGLVPGAEEEWFPDFREAHWLTPEPHGVGALREYRLSYARTTERFIAWDRGRHLAFYMSRSSLPLASLFMEDYRLTPDDDGGTDVVWRVGYCPAPWVRPVHSPLRFVFHHTFRKASAQLKAYLERHPLAMEGTEGWNTRLCERCNAATTPGSCRRPS